MEKDEFKNLNLDQIENAFYLLFFGHLISLSIYLCEYIYQRLLLYINYNC